MRIQTGRLVGLGYGRWVRSDEVVAIEPILEGRGPGRRTLVWVRGVNDPLVASRSDAAIVEDLIAPAEDVVRLGRQRETLTKIAAGLDKVSPTLRRVIEEESGIDLVDLANDARKVV